MEDPVTVVTTWFVGWLSGKVKACSFSLMTGKLPPVTKRTVTVVISVLGLAPPSFTRTVRVTSELPVSFSLAVMAPLMGSILNFSELRPIRE